MGYRVGITLLVMVMVALPLKGFAENWVEFHQEKWSQKSGKRDKKLNFSSRYFYDAESLVRTSAQDVTLWMKDVSNNDSYYVKKGSPQSETIFRQIHLWCKLKKYEIKQADDVDGGLNESLSEDIKPGSYYEKLHTIACGIK